MCLCISCALIETALRQYQMCDKRRHFDWNALSTVSKVLPQTYQVSVVVVIPHRIELFS